MYKSVRSVLEQRSRDSVTCPGGNPPRWPTDEPPHDDPRTPEDETATTEPSPPESTEPSPPESSSPESSESSPSPLIARPGRRVDIGDRRPRLSP